jgi:hypothetical protein
MCDQCNEIIKRASRETIPLSKELWILSGDHTGIMLSLPPLHYLSKKSFIYACSFLMIYFQSFQSYLHFVAESLCHYMTFCTLFIHFKIKCFIGTGKTLCIHSKFAKEGAAVTKTAAAATTRLGKHEDATRGAGLHKQIF